MRPVIVTAAVFAAVVAAIPAAHADSAGDAMTPGLSGVGLGNNGPVSGAIAQMGQSICPMLVKPGGSLASGAAQMSGHGGLEAPMAGFLAQNGDPVAVSGVDQLGRQRQHAVPASRRGRPWIATRFNRRTGAWVAHRSARGTGPAPVSGVLTTLAGSAVSRTGTASGSCVWSPGQAATAFCPVRRRSR